MPWYHEGEPIAEDDAGLRRWLEEEVWYGGVRKRGCRDDVLRDWLLARALERADAEFGDASRLLGYYYERHEDWSLTAIVELLGWDVLEDDSTYAELMYGVSDMGCVLAQLARAPCMQGVADPRDLYAIRERVIAVRRDLDGLLDAVSRAQGRMVPEPPCPDRYGLDADGDADLYDMWRRME